MAAGSESLESWRLHDLLIGVTGLFTFSKDVVDFPMFSSNWLPLLSVWAWTIFTWSFETAAPAAAKVLSASHPFVSSTEVPIPVSVPISSSTESGSVFAVGVSGSGVTATGVVVVSGVLTGDRVGVADSRLTFSFDLLLSLVFGFASDLDILERKELDPPVCLRRLGGHGEGQLGLFRSPSSEH